MVLYNFANSALYKILTGIIFQFYVKLRTTPRISYVWSCHRDSCHRDNFILTSLSRQDFGTRLDMVLFSVLYSDIGKINTEGVGAISSEIDR